MSQPGASFSRSEMMVSTEEGDLKFLLEQITKIATTLKTLDEKVGKLEEKLNEEEHATKQKRRILVRSPNCSRHSIKNKLDYTVIKFENVISGVLSAPDAFVSRGQKCWFEVSFVQRSHSITGVKIGWGWVPGTNSLEADASYWFEPFRGKKYHGKGRKGTSKCGPKRDCLGVLGVALDMIEGTIRYSWDGNWDDPGLVFKGINLDLKLFPEFLGHGLSSGYVEIEVNFGARSFMYGPPDSSFEKLFDKVL